MEGGFGTIKLIHYSGGNPTESGIPRQVKS